MKIKFIIALLTAIHTAPAFAQNAESSELVQKRNDFETMLNSGTKDWYNNPNAKEWLKNCHTNIFSVLDAIEILPEWRLAIDLPDTEGLGDESHIYVENVNSGKKLYGYLNYIRLKSISSESCWQWFLIYNIKNMLPTFWHGGYSSSDLILTEEDHQQILKYIEVIPDSLIDSEEELAIGGLSETNFRILKDFKIKPVRVDVNELKRTAEITLCTWNDWVGLTEKTFCITIKDDNTANVEKIDYNTIIEYDCGVTY